MKVPGTVTLTFLNRQCGGKHDYDFFSVAASGLSLSMIKNNVTMSVSGSVGEISAHVSSNLGLTSANSQLLHYTPSSPVTNNDENNETRP